MKVLSTSFFSYLLISSSAPGASFTFVTTSKQQITTFPQTRLSMSTSMQTETTNPRLEGLAFELDDGTRKSHSMAENTAFVSGFFKGLSTRDSYAQLLTSLYFVYDAMETVFDSTSEQGVQLMDDKSLRRMEALKRDMDYFYGTDWQSQIQPSKAATKYVNRILEVADNDPKLLIAHQYSRYLGDLFGGQMMSGMASRSLSLDEGKGVSFYQFDDIDSTKSFITQWYSKLNTLELTDNERQAIVDEANLVFALNIEIFEELEGSAAKAVWTMAWNTFREKVSGFLSS